MWWSLGVVLVARVGFSTLLSSILMSKLSCGDPSELHVPAETTKKFNSTNYPPRFPSFSVPLIYSAHFDVSHAIWAPGGSPPKILPACTAVGFRALRAPALYTSVFIFHIGF